MKKPQDTGWIIRRKNKLQFTKNSINHPKRIDTVKTRKIQTKQGSVSILQLVSKPITDVQGNTKRPVQKQFTVKQKGKPTTITNTLHIQDLETVNTENRGNGELKKHLEIRGGDMEKNTCKTKTIIHWHPKVNQVIHNLFKVKKGNYTRIIRQNKVDVKP